MRGKRLPDYMPIMRKKMESGTYQPVYEERELTEPVDLCDAEGKLHPAAVGWSRRPLVRANLSGHWGRKKRWNFWNWISPDFVFSVTLADLDYASFCSVLFLDFRDGTKETAFALRRGGAFLLPEEVEGPVNFSGGGLFYTDVNEGEGRRVSFEGRSLAGKEIKAEFRVHDPPGHESLNVVVPWSAERFQCNSKHNTRPCAGVVSIGERQYEMDPANCHGVQDWGRGMWPYRSFWNWGAATGVHNGIPVGINVGAKWTTGTGSNENGLCIAGRLYKIMEDLRWEYDPADWRRPWRVKSDYSDMIDVTLTPFLIQPTRLTLGIFAMIGVCCFGRWQGRLRFEGNEMEIRDLIGWAEEFALRM